MVSPINGEKPIATSAERLAESSRNNRPEQPVASPASSPEKQPAESAADNLKLEQARQLFDLENRTARPAGKEITTPEAARSLLDQILEQISSTPEQAVKAQGSVSSPLANLLQVAPG